MKRKCFAPLYGHNKKMKITIKLKNTEDCYGCPLLYLNYHTRCKKCLLGYWEIIWKPGEVFPCTPIRPKQCIEENGE